MITRFGTLPAGSCARIASVVKAATLIAGVGMLAGCSGKQIDLYDYLDGKDKPAAQQAASQPLQQPPGQPIQGSGDAGSQYGDTDQALANARPAAGGIERVSLKNAQGVAVTVDDLPVTNYDISQRINLENALGGRLSTDFPTRKRILDTIVNEQVAKSKAKRSNFEISDKELDERVDGMVGRMKISRADLRKRLAEKGVDETTLKNQMQGSMYIRWVMQQQQVDTDVKVDQAKVDAEYQKIVSDPRLKPVTVIFIQQVDLPVENAGEAMRQQLLYARAVEAQQIMSRYKGCKSLSAASRDIFNVKIGKRIEADFGKLPDQLRNALSKAGTQKLIGPIPSPQGVRLFANCGTRKIEPPRPSREQIEQSLRAERFDQVVSQAMAEARKDSFIDYKDAAFRPSSN